MKNLFIVAAVMTLTACGGMSNRESIDVSYTQIPADKGLIAFRVGQRAIEKSGVLSNKVTLVGYGRKLKEGEMLGEHNPETYEISKVYVRSWDFVESPTGNYQKKDFLIEEKAGKYKAAPPVVAGRLPVKPEPLEFTVKPGQITYIGQFDIGTIYRESYIGSKLKKTTLHISEGGPDVIGDILKAYPELKNYKISNQAPKEEKVFRTRPAPAPVVQHYYYTTYKKK